MRHRKQGRGLSRSPSHRKAMLSNLATSVLEVERVQTTTAKAKEVRRLVERLITFDVADQHLTRTGRITAMPDVHNGAVKPKANGIARPVQFSIIKLSQ